MKGSKRENILLYLSLPILWAQDGCIWLRKKIKPVTAMLMAVALLVSLMPLTAWALPMTSYIYWAVVDTDGDSGDSLELRLSDTTITADDGTVVDSGSRESSSTGSIPPWQEHRNTITSVKVLGPIRPSTTQNWFQGFANCTYMDLAKLNTCDVEDMSCMFEGCSSLTELDISHFDTAKVDAMSYMFEDCEKLTTLDLSSFDTANVTTMNSMFNGCKALKTLTFGAKWDTSKVTTFWYMFCDCQSLTALDLSGFNAANVTLMSNMFSNCKSLTSLDLSNFNGAKGTDISGMFRNCTSLTELDLSGLDMSNITNTMSMFYNTGALRIIKTPKTNPHADEIELGAKYSPDTVANASEFLPVTSEESVTLYRVGYIGYSGTEADASIPANPENYVYNPTEAQYFTLNEPVKEGSVFTGWTIGNASGSTATLADNAVTIPAGSFGRITMTANWKAAHSHPACGDSSCTDTNHAAAVWTAWDGTGTFPGGNVYLTGDVTLTSALTISGTVNLCLNGHTIRAAGGYLDVSGTLNLCSCAAGGSIIRTSTTEALICADGGATANLYNVTLDGGAVWSGTEDIILGRGTTNSGVSSSAPLIDAGYQRTAGGHITLGSGVVLKNNECSDAGHGGAVTIGEDGTLVINGATICNNAKTSGNAGAIKAYAGAQITVNSGEIYGNAAYKHGGAVQIFGGDSTDDATAVFTMNGGTIRNNKADGVGGAIAVSNFSKFVMSGGSITDNATTDSSKRGGGVGFADADTEMAISGDAVIADNEANGTANNLYIGTNSCNTVTVGEMKNGASIGVTMKSSSGGVFTNGGAAYAEYFESDDPAYTAVVDGENLKLIKTPAEVPNVQVSDDLVLTYGEYTGQKFTATVDKKDGYTYVYQWIQGYTVIGNADTFTIPDDLGAGNHSYYLAVGAKRNDNGEIAWETIRDILVTVNPKALDAANVALSQDTFTYNGNEQKPSVTVSAGSKTLTENADYTLSWSADCTNAGSKTVTVTFKGNYSGEAVKTFKIEPKEIGIAWSNTTLTYNGAAQQPTATATGVVTGEQIALLLNAPETNAGSYTATVHSIDGATAQNYKLPTNKSTSFTIEQQALTILWGNGTFTYDSTEKFPAFNVEGIWNADDVQVTKAGAQTSAGEYTAQITGLTGADAGNYKLTGTLTKDFVINKADQAAPVVNKADETISGKNDGKITDVSANMEYRAEGEDRYTAITGETVENLADGKYYVRVKGDSNHNPSADTAVMIGAGRMLTVTVPQNQVGYTMTVDKSTATYGEAVKVTFALNDGYSAADGFAVKLNGGAITLSNGEYTVANTTEDLAFTVEGVADITAPLAQIDIKNNKWTSFWNGVTFGLFFNETQDVTVTATDTGSGVNAIQYYLASGELELEEVKQIPVWNDYNATFQINPDNAYVVYVKVTDNAGNVSYLNSDGVVLDQTVPVLVGIENNESYYGDKRFKALDDYLDDLKVDGVDVIDEMNGDNEYTIVADNAEHIVTVTDKAGNVTEYRITVYKNYTVTYKVDGNTISTQTVGHGKDATSPAIPEKEGYTKTAPIWDKDGTNITADTEINAVYTINEYTITFKDENGIYKTLTVKHGEAVTMPEVPAKDGYIVTWDTTIEVATSDATVNAVYTKNAVSDIPQTGDNSNLTLWWILLLVSAARIILTTVEQKKRKAMK